MQGDLLTNTIACWLLPFWVWWFDPTTSAKVAAVSLLHVIMNNEDRHCAIEKDLKKKYNVHLQFKQAIFKAK